MVVDHSKRQAIANKADALVSLRKVKQAMNLKQVQLRSEMEANFLSNQEKQRMEVNIRSLKHFFFKTASL